MNGIIAYRNDDGELVVLRSHDTEPHRLCCVGDGETRKGIETRYILAHVELRGER